MVLIGKVLRLIYIAIILLIFLTFEFILDLSAQFFETSKNAATIFLSIFEAHDILSNNFNFFLFRIFNIENIAEYVMEKLN